MRLGLGTDISVGYRQPLFGGIPFLLDTYTGAAAAYSLRQLRTGVTNVVGVRRSSDNAEADFTAAEVADGTLVNWVNTNVDVYTSDFTSGNEDLNEANATGTDGETIAGVSDAYKLTLNGGNVFHQATKGGFNTNNLFSVSFDYYIPSSNSKVDGIQFGFVSGTTSVETTLDSWTTISVNSYNSSASGNLFFRAREGGSTIIDADGDVFYLKNIVVTQTTADGYVVTWYDQSGNGNNATQATAANQPKIVDSGSMVLENGKPAIDFDGVDDFIVSSTGGLLTENNFLITSVAKYTNNDILDIGWRIASGLSDPRLSLFIQGNSFEFEDSTNDYLISGLSKLNIQSISSIVYNPLGNSYYYANGVQDGSVDTSLMLSGENFGNDLYLGSRWGGQYNTECLFQEFIIYPSDQSSNRTAIEQNINDHYSIYL